MSDKSTEFIYAILYRAPGSGNVVLYKKEPRRTLYSCENVPFGILVSDGKGRIGYSFCNFEAGDTFDLGKGIDVAKSRIGQGLKIPAKVKRTDLNNFKLRIERFFEKHPGL